MARLNVVECRRETLRLLILIRIDGAFRVPSRIEDKAASAADRKHDITGREIQRPGSILHQQAAVGWNAQHFVERVTAAQLICS